MIAIAVYVGLFSITFLCLGNLVNRTLNLKLNGFLVYPAGLIAFFGIVQFSIYPIVQLKLPTWIFFGIMILIMVVSVLFGIKGLFKSLRWKPVLVGLISVLVYAGGMVYLSSLRSLGQNSFDTNFYLSLVVQGSFSPHFSFVEYGTGLSTQFINVQYDFQSFYSVGSFILASLEPVLKTLNPSYQSISTGVFIWSISVLFYIFEFLTFIGFVIQMKLQKNPVITFIGIFLLGYIALIYFNNIFTFFGNTYRTWFLAFLMFEIYRSFESKEHHPVWLMLLSSALISVSSSGFFLGIIVLTPYVMGRFLNKTGYQETVRSILWIITPTLLFALFFLFANRFSWLLTTLFLSLVFYILMNASCAMKPKTQGIILKGVSVLVLYGLPAVILLFSITMTVQGNALPQPFFFDHRAYDMVWYYFNHENINVTLINILYFTSLTVYLILAKGPYRWYILTLLVLFINPISAQFVAKFLASVVFYRSFEVIFNPFTSLLFMTLMIEAIPSVKLRYGVSALLLVWFVPIAYQHSQMFYHSSFVPSSSYSSLYRVESSQIEPLSVLKTKIVLEKYDQARVVSQIEMVRGFVPHVVTPISNEEIRSINKYTINKATSDLLTIFENRDYIGQEIFDQKPDYANTCKYLMDARIDFVVVDKNQFFIDENGLIIPLYFKVRDCATPVYENEAYFIYQFYW